MMNRNYHNKHGITPGECTLAFEYTHMVFHEANGPEQVTEMFFWGSHADIGGSDGGVIDSSKVTLKSLTGEMSRRGIELSFDEYMLPGDGNVLWNEPRKAGGWSESVFRFLSGSSKARKITDAGCLHPTAVARYQNVPEWRPKSLAHLKDAITSLAPENM